MALVMVLTMVSMPWAGVLDGPALEQERGPAWATGSATATEDTLLNVTSPNSSYGNDANLNLTSAMGLETRLLFTFPIMSNVTGGLVPAAGGIQSASLTLYTTSGNSQGTIHVYAAELNGDYDETNASWNNRTHNTTWHTPGAEGDTDRGDWEPRSQMGSSSVTINVTALAQQALARQDTHMDVIISMTGLGMFTIASSEHPTSGKRPSLALTYSVAAPSASPAVTLDSPIDGSVSVLSDLVLTADTTPTMGWINHAGTGVELQVSRSEDFRQENDSDWVWNSWVGSGFSYTTNGSFTVPSSDQLDEGMVAHWRMRATDSDQLSQWQTGFFYVPELGAVNNQNNTATLELYRDTLNISQGTVHDAWLRSGSSNVSEGDGENIWIGNSNNTSRADMAAVYHVDLDQTGMHSNATVLSAYFQLRRTDRQGDAWISIHRMNQANWSEETVSWDYSSGNNTWAAGSLLDSIGPSLDVQNGNKSGPTFSFDVTYAVQEYLREVHQSGSGNGVSFLLQASGANNAWARFAASEESAWTYRPKLVLTYAWGDGVGPTDTPTINSPKDGQGVWEVSASNNITADLTPEINWSSTGHQNDEVRIELAMDSTFTTGPLYRADSRDVNSGFNTTAGTFTIPAGWGVDYGEKYYWRLRFVEDGDWGDYSQQGFYVSTINSTWVSNNTWEIRLRHDNATTSSSPHTVPYCGDTYIDSLGANNVNDQGGLSISSSQYTLIGCDIRSHVLPAGLAVTDAELRLTTDFAAGTLSASVYEMINHRWEETEATWENYDSVNNWSANGAGGSDRGQLLDSSTITSSTTTGTWNVTVAVQNSMRWNVPADFLIIGSGSGQASMYDKESASTAASYPELVIRYSPGSMEVPDPPSPTFPINGEWSVTSGMVIAPEGKPSMTWNHTGTVSANGWVVELDTTPTFNSNNLVVARSWVQVNDFDVQNNTYIPANNLTTSQVWHWRVRGSSLTNQLGNWSSTVDFVVPNIESGSLDADNSYLVIRPGAAVASQNVPSVPDTWIDAGSNATHHSANHLMIGCQSSACPKTTMLSFPLSELPSPANSRISSAELGLYTVSVNTSSSGHSPRISVHRTLPNWNGSANGNSWDGDATNNSSTMWHTSGGIGSSDIGPLVDVGVPISSNWFKMNVTEIVHAALTDGDDKVNVSLRSATNLYAEAMFFSADYIWESYRPYLKVFYRNGTGTAANGSASLALPANNAITWNVTGHALASDTLPMMEWTHPSPSSVDGWRLFVYNDSDDVRQGYTIFDSRIHPGFDLTNLTYTPSSPFDLDSRQRWFVQTIKDDIFGDRSSDRFFDVPNDIGWAIDSTDARLRVSQGGALTRLESPDAFADATLNTYASTTNYGNSQSITVGRSTSTSSSAYKSYTVMRIDVSTLPVPTPWEAIEGQLELFCHGCSSTTMLSVSVHPLRADFVESQVTYLRNSTNNTWPTGMFGGAVDTTWVQGNGWYGWNVTQLVQAARLRGDDTLLLGLEGTSASGTIYKQFHSSEYSIDWELRPVLNITHRSGNQWLPNEVTNPSPFGQETLWQPNEPRPSQRDPVTLTWSHAHASNVTSWQIQLSSTERFLSASTNELDSSVPGTYDGTFVTSPLSYEIDVQGDLPPGWNGWSDDWLHWRIRPIVGDMIGNWTDCGKFRVPDDQGSGDGLGNHTVTMARGSVFTDTGNLPTVPDTWIDSSTAGASATQGSNATLAVGNSPFQSGHEAVSLVEFDLGELPFPSNMLATTVSLRMYRVGYSTSGTHTLSVYGCNSFSESTTWNSWNLGANCNTNAASSVSASATGLGVWYDWDVTNLVNAAAPNGTVSMAIRSTNYSGYLQFSSSESQSEQYRPQLVIGYVDNVNNISPPATPILTSPFNQQVLYNVSTYDDFLLESPVRPTMSWAYDSDTTGYILRMWNGTVSNTYYSWNATSSQGSFGQSSFTPGWDMEEGGVYYWNIQGINGSILGGRSSTWVFGIGNPDTQALGNNIWRAEYQEGASVSDFNHPTILDAHIDEGLPNNNFETTQVRIGSGCTGGPSSTYDCIGIYQVDLGQLPLTHDARAHSGVLNLYLDSISAPTSTWLDITAYAVLNTNFEENQATWNQASLGNAWASAGLGAGTDRGVIALDTVRVTSLSSGWITIDISGALSAQVNGTLSVVLIGTPQPVPSGTPQFIANIVSSESTNLANRPYLEFDYTSVFNISLTGPATTDADTSQQFSATLLDVDNNAVAGMVEWDCTDGSIDSNGLFTPDSTGNATISARFGRVIVTHVISVSPGNAVQLFGGPMVSAITSDESVEMWFDVRDANGNPVPGEAVSFTVTNGSIAQGYLMTTPIVSVTYMPWQVGVQWVNVTWSNQTLSLQITVDEGLPDYLVLSGYETIPAGETRDYNWTAYDAHDNPVTPSRLLSVNWTVEDGNITQTGVYTADKVGIWNISLTTGYGLSVNTTTETVHGAIFDLIVNASAYAITADDSVTFNTTRIDIRGNSLEVTLPANAWVVSNGTIVEGDPVQWLPNVAATQTIDVTMEGVTTRVFISVNHGEAVGIDIRSSDGPTLISGQLANIDAYNFDQFGNEWEAIIETWEITQPMADQNWLSASSADADFQAVTVGTWTIEATYIHEGSQAFQDSISFDVEAGALASITLSGQGSSVTADDSVSLQPVTRDQNSNLLPTDGLRWFTWDGNSPTQRPSGCIDWGNEITSSMQSSEYVWEASDEGLWYICAMEGSYQAMIEVTVSHGEAAVLHKVASGDRLVAGASLSAIITATDADGNEFSIDVSWSGSDASYFTAEEDQGTYTWAGTVAGDYTLVYIHDETGLFDEWAVTVDAAPLDSLEMTISPGLTVSQQDTITIDVRAFDAFGNEISVPPSAVLYHGGEKHIMNKVSDSQWTVYMVDQGTSKITVVALEKSDSQDIVVEQTLFGFFEEGGTLYYVGAGLLGLIVLGVIVVLVVLLRRVSDDDDYDDYDDYVDEDYIDDGAGGDYEESYEDEEYVEPAAEESYDDGGGQDADISVDEDGTEWWEDESGVWWYRSVDMDDWEVWED